jgi:glutamate 5-kinase
MRRFKKRVVIKVGSNVLTNYNNRIVEPILGNIVR